MPLAIYLSETDGDIVIREVSIGEAQQLEEQMHYSDFALIRGSSRDILKNFDEQRPRSYI